MNKHGQSIIEYTLIAILVVLGIVYMGPYALRSVNGYFKLWDDSVQDSFEENLSQAPVSVIPDINLTCNCTTQTDGVCGGLPGSSCQPGYRGSTSICTPQGCGGEGSTCTLDPTCCGQTPRGCGGVALPQGTNGTYSVPDCTNPPPASNDCYYGQILMASLCPISTSIPACPNNSTACPPASPTNCIPNPYCQANNTCPLPTCTGSLPTGTIYCSTHTTTPPAAGLSQNYQIAPATNGCPSNSSTVPNCQYTCDNGTNPDASGNCAYKVAPAPIGAACPPIPLSCSCTSSGWSENVVTTVNCSTGTWANPQNWCGSSLITKACSIAELGFGCSPQGPGCTNGPSCGCGNPGIPGTQCLVQYTFSTP